MEAQLRVWVDHAILARDHIGRARRAGVLWYLGLALAPWRVADPRQRVVLPVNKCLEATPPGTANAETRGLVETWGKLHAVRSALGLGATLVYLWATLKA
jgi:hypothetical protein